MGSDIPIDSAVGQSSAPQTKPQGAPVEGRGPWPADLGDGLGQSAEVADARAQQESIFSGGRQQETEALAQAAVCSSLTVEDLREVIYAQKLMFMVYGKTVRDWGPEEKLPLAHHAGEVGAMLLGAGCCRDVVIAGLFHDLFEGYIEFPPGRTADCVATVIERKWGRKILDLIEAMTEPGRQSKGVGWLERKQAGFEKVRQGSVQVAAVSCASKISTLRAGNKYLWETGTIEKWSSGSLEDNIGLYCLYRDEYARKQIPGLLLELFSEELDRFKAWRDKIN